MRIRYGQGVTRRYRGLERILLILEESVWWVYPYNDPRGSEKEYMLGGEGITCIRGGKPKSVLKLKIFLFNFFKVRNET